MKSILIAAAAVLAAPVFASAQQLASNQPTTVAVHFQDLDLANRVDADTLLRRIGDAALEACGASSFSLPDYRAAVQHSDCYLSGIDQAVATLNAPAVTDAYRHHAYVEVGANGDRALSGE